MAKNDPREDIVESFEALKKTMKTAGFAALETEDFARSRELTSLMEDLVELQRRTVEVLGDDSDRSAPEAPAPLADGYPRFFRRGALLVKEGLRRDGESTYEQKMPRDVHDEVLGALRTLKRTQDEFHAPDVTSRVTCPDYQVYLLLNLLQETGYLDNPQRGLYRFRHRSEADWAGQIWDAIPQESDVGTQ